MIKKSIPLIILVLIIIKTAIYADSSTVSAMKMERVLEMSVFCNMSTIGSNYNVQSDICAGVNLPGNLNSTISFSTQYRNNSLVTNELLSFGGTLNFKKQLIRTSLTIGMHTQRIGSYRDIVPCSGIEVLYAYKISEMVSLRIKERVSRFSETDHKITETSTFAGIALSFLKKHN